MQTIESHERRMAAIVASLNDPWRKQAACLGKSREVAFFPPSQNETRVPGQTVQRLMRAARNLCIECPVKRDCLFAALDSYEHGIWGGTDFEERVRLRAIFKGTKPHPGKCPDPDCESDLTLPIRGSNPPKVRCLDCNMRWSDDGQATTVPYSHPPAAVQAPIG